MLPFALFWSYESRLGVVKISKLFLAVVPRNRTNSPSLFAPSCKLSFLLSTPTKTPTCNALAVFFYTDLMVVLSFPE